MDVGKQNPLAPNSAINRTKEFLPHVFTSEYWRNFLPSLAKEWRSGLRSISRFCREAGGVYIPLHLLAFATVISLGIVLPLYYLLDWATRFRMGDACQPDGRFAVFSSYSLWAVSGAFQISMGFGAMSFSNAKLIDVIWDVVVGRGGQVLLALIAYKVTTKSLTMSMEQLSIPISTFAAVTLQDSTFTSFSRQLYSFFGIKTWRHRLRMLWILLSTLFIVAFPTLVGSMTGYAPVTKPFLLGIDGKLIPFASYRPVIYIVHDAERLGLNPPLVLSGVPGKDGSPRDICTSRKTTPPDLHVGNESLLWFDWELIDERCQMIWHVREYVLEYGFSGHTNTSSTFNKSGESVQLSAPSLNITMVAQASLPFEESQGLTFESFLLDFSLSNSQVSEEESAKYVLTGTNTVLNVTEVNQFGSCQQTAEYKWGFSFLLLFIVLVFLNVWIVGTYILLVDAYLHSRLHIIKRDMGIYRAALDISSAIQHSDDNDVNALTSNTILTKRLQGRSGVKIGLQHLNGVLLPNTHMTVFQKWARTGGYARWTPRIILVLLFMAILVSPLYALALYWPTMMAALIPVFVAFFFCVLLLGDEKQRALYRKDPEGEDAPHATQQSAAERKISPKDSRISLSDINASNQSDHEPDTQHAHQVSHSASSAAVQII